MESSLERDLEGARKENRLSEEEVDLLRALEQQPEKTAASKLLSNFAATINRPDKQHDESNSATSSTKKSPPEALSALEFFEYVVQCAGKKYGESEFSEVRFVVDDYLVRRKSAEEVINWARSTISEEGKEFEMIAVNVMGAKITHHGFTKHEFTKAAADKAFGLVLGDCNKLAEFFHDRLVPINEPKNNLPGVLHPYRAYVEIDGDNGFDCLTDSLQVDKSFAIVVAGESGSGKSVLSCLEVLDRGYLSLYLLLRLRKEKCDSQRSNHSNQNADEDKHKKSLDVSDIYEKKPQPEFYDLHEFLRQQLLVHQGNAEAVQALCGIKAKANVSRNRWANSLFENALEHFVKENINARHWKDGAWDPAQLPKKVAIILDEVTDIDLVEALIDNVRVTTKKLMPLVQDQIVLVLAGTGLDAMRYPDRVGTNREYWRLVKLKGPNLETIRDRKKISEEVYNAVNQGLFSIIMKTNSRMLFRGVLPILHHPFFTCDGKFEPEKTRQRLEERLKRVASFGPIMDYIPRFFVRQNVVGDLTKDNRERLLADAFLYHLITAIESVKKSEDRAKTVTENQRKELAVVKAIRRKEIDLDSEDIFFKGVAARSGTSKALKYLACFGLTCEVREGFGNEFEELTALHYMRLMEVQSYTVKRVVLNHAWPPKSTPKEIQETDIERLRNVLKDQAVTELIGFTCPTPHSCTVFSQGTPTPQGGYVLVLLVNPEGMCELECIQCKHYKSTQGVDMMSWWSSLGIVYDQDGKCDVAPDTGKAGYCYAGLDAFRNLLQNKIGRPVALGRRTMAVSFPMPPRAEFSIPGDDCTRVWFREMLEPTISTFKLRPQHDGRKNEDSLSKKRGSGSPPLTEGGPKPHVRRRCRRTKQY